ncbi:MAG: PAS domain S-box protein [Candidatus Kryptoniota bacterium]
MTELISTLSEEFAAEYSSAMQDHISHGGEFALHRAYELGRKALDNGQIIIDVAKLHSTVLLKVLNGTSPDNATEVITSAATFLSEFLSPFEMTFRGFMEAVSSLKIEIGERQRAEEALKESERYYKSLIENALDIVALLDANGYVQYISPSVEKVLGYAQDELIGKNVFGFIHPDDVDAVLEIFSKGKTPARYIAKIEYRIRHKNGEWSIFESIGKNLLDDPFINGIIVNLRDITVRRSLEDIRRKYEFIANASKELMVLINADYKCEGVNEAFCTSLSQNREDIIGKFVPDVLGNNLFSEIFKEHIDKCFTGVEIRYEGWLELPAFGRRFLELYFYPYHNINSIVTHIVIAIRDATSRELAQQEIKSSEEKYRTLFETSKEGVLLLHASTGVIADMNTFTLDFLGYPRTALFGKELWEVDAVKDIPVSKLAFQEVVEKNSGRCDEIELSTAEGRKVKVEFIWLTYEVKGSKIIQCHLWDITERKKLQEELNKAARQRTEDLKRFALLAQQAQEEERHRISRELHDDICQRLTALNIGMNVFEDAIGEHKQISLTRLRSVKKEINNLISDVRKMSYNLRPSALDHFGLVSALKMFCAEFEKLQGVKVKFETNIMAHQRYDPDIEIALYRIAQEAITNSVKHAKVKIANFKIIEEDGHLTLTVVDRGIGFNPASFYSRPGSEKHFGLINMRERTELLGGTFRLDSVVRKGTTVSVNVPIGGRSNEN